jgi:PPOX class probable FMN-dependent enzyme
MEFELIDSLDKRSELYDAPMELAVKKQRYELDKYAIQFLRLSAFATISTSSADGAMDCSPRGDYPGFIQVLDEKTVAMPDRPGNNRLDSLSNIVENPAIGMLVMVPGFNECLRINGSAKIVTNGDILALFEYKGKLPRSVIVVEINEIYFHCAKAITRSGLWKSESQVDRKVMPSLGKILMEQVDPSKSQKEIEQVEKLIADNEKNSLY